MAEDGNGALPLPGAALVGFTGMQQSKYQQDQGDRSARPVACENDQD